MKTLRTLGMLFALIGLGLLAGAYVAYERTNDFIDRALSATGTVIELTRSSQIGSAGGNSTYRPGCPVSGIARMSRSMCCISPMTRRTRPFAACCTYRVASTHAARGWIFRFRSVRVTPRCQRMLA